MRIADGNPQVFPILYQLDKFVHAERMFDWMIANGFTGSNLVEIFQKGFSHSWLTLGKFIVMKVNKETQMKKVIAGKDFVSRN